MPETARTAQWMYDDEISFWRGTYSSMPRAELESMTSNERSIDSRVLAAVRTAPEGFIRVLDVGCGPVSVLGWHHPTLPIELTGADPLAQDYNELLSEFGLSVPYRTYAVPGEKLEQRFEAGYFDYVFSRNALDHVEDAPLTLRNMIEVTREGGVVEVEVFENEAVAAGYSGLHRWNFCRLDEQILVWNRSNALLLDYLVAPYTYTFEALPSLNGNGRSRLVITTHKTLPMSLKHHSVPGVVDIFYDLDRGILQLRSLRSDGKNRLFLHTHGIDPDGKTDTKAKSYLWPTGADCLYMKFPPMREITSVTLGEYEVRYRGEDPEYFNFWETEVH